MSGEILDGPAVYTPLGSVLAFAPKYREKGRDADEFKREAGRFVDLHGGRLVLVDNRQRPVLRRREVIEAISGWHDLSAVAFFCHGYNRFKIQFGFHAKHDESMSELAYVISTACARKPIVPLYCCVLGGGPGVGGDGGFADVLRDKLLSRGARKPAVFAHVGPGHTTKRPFVRVFDTTDKLKSGSTASSIGLPSGHWLADLKGGHWLVDPDDEPRLFRRWKAALKKKGSTLRFEFPFMTYNQIVTELMEAGE